MLNSKEEIEWILSRKDNAIGKGGRKPTMVFISCTLLEYKRFSPVLDNYTSCAPISTTFWWLQHDAQISAGTSY